MTSMSYCLFRNTEADLDDCILALQEVNFPQTQDECQAALRMQAKAELFIELMTKYHDDIMEVAQRD